MYSQKTDNEPILPSEIENIKTTWNAVMDNSKEFGCLIFLKFLERYNYFSRFSKFGHIPSKDLENNKDFQNHTYSILVALSNVFLHLEDESIFKNSLISLGKTHYKKNVTQEEFNQLKEVVLEFLVDSFQLSKQDLRAWNKAFDKVHYYVFAGLRAD